MSLYNYIAETVEALREHKELVQLLIVMFGIYKMSSLNDFSF